LDSDETFIAYGRPKPSLLFYAKRRCAVSTPCIEMIKSGEEDKMRPLLERSRQVLILTQERLRAQLPIPASDYPIYMREEGAALTTGFRAATGDIVLIQDADLEYDPADYRAMIRPIVEGNSDVVMGSRFILYHPKFFGKRRSPYLSHYIGNILITSITNLLY